MKRFPLLAGILLLGCGTVPANLAPTPDATPNVSDVVQRNGTIAFDLRKPSHVAAIEVVYGKRLSVLAPADSLGLFSAGTHALAFRTVRTTQALDPAAPRRETRVWQHVAVEPCVSDPPVRYDPVTLDPGRDGDRIMVRRETRYCPAPASRQVLGGTPPATRWVIVVASDQPIDLELMAANLTRVGSTGFAPDLLATVAAGAMAGHDGSWSASAVRQ